MRLRRACEHLGPPGTTGTTDTRLRGAGRLNPPSMHPLLQTARPPQWLKNALVFGAPLAAGVLDEPDQLGRVLLAFVAFCIGSSGTYFWNDVLDVDADRQHPAKASRPVASGQVSLATARIVGSAAILVSIVVMSATGRPEAVLVLVGYLVLTLSYSVVWKHIAVLDLAAIAGGFVLRAMGGAAAVDVRMSSWFVLVTAFGALFVVAGKRLAEARDLGGGGVDVRSTLGDYSEGFLRFVMATSCVGAVVSYGVWAFETRDLARSDLPYAELSIVPVLIAFFRYAYVLERGAGAAPEDVFGRDRVIQVLGLLWLVVFGAAVYA